MNLDANVQKTLTLLLQKWKLLVVFAIIGGLLAFGYTAKFTRPTYTSTVEFLASAVDPSTEINEANNTSGDSVRTSNTSKMNYAMKMIDTYIEILQTNEFSNSVAEDLNKNLGTAYSTEIIKSATTIEKVEETSMFKMTVTTHNAENSYQIAHQLEKSVPKQMKSTNSGLIQATVQDKAIKAMSAGSRGYPKKCLIGAIIGIVLAAAYVILRDLLDVRIRTSEDLLEKYDIPVLGTVPDFGNKKVTEKTKESTKGAKK